MQRSDKNIIIKKTHYTDISELEKLMEKGNGIFSRRTNLFETIDRCMLSLTARKQDQTIIAGACFDCHPGRHRTAQENWEKWFNINIGIPNVNSINSVFLRFIVLKCNYEEISLIEICRFVFTLLIDIQNILILSDEPCESKMTNIFPFNTVYHRGQAEKLSVSVALRCNVFPVLHSRIAMVEDNDDVTPLFNSQTDVLRKTYGNFYVSELVEAQNDNLKCVVAENNSCAVGFISATTKFDVDKLNDSYDLDIFNGLYRHRLKDTVEAKNGGELESGNISEKHDDGCSSQEPLRFAENSSKDYSQSSTCTLKISQPNPWTQRHLLSAKPGPETVNRSSRGPPDAFAIQLYAMKPDFETRFIDMLPLLFDQFPGLNYAVISVPRTVPVFPLLQHFVHCRVRNGKDPEHELYVFHRAGLLQDFHIRRARLADTAQIQNLIKNMNSIDQELILQDLKAFYTNRGDQGNHGCSTNCFVAEAVNRVVGLAIIRDELQIEWIRAHYDIEEYIYFNHHAHNEHATLYHFLLAANFSCRTEFFLKEILRLANKTCLYYRILPPYVTSCLYNRATLVTCLSSMYPVRPRRQIVYPPKEVLGVKQPEARVLQPVDALPALFMGTSKLFTEPKNVINARVVVVGASTTGLAVLETLANCSHIRLTNLVLLSPHGLPGDTLQPPDENEVKFLTTDHGYSLEELGQLALRHCVHVIHGKLTAIDRKFKKITIDHRKKLSYDYLILTTGLQYHTSCPNGANVQKLMKTSEAPFLPTRRFSDDYPQAIPPKNLFLINNAHDAHTALQWVRMKYLPTLNMDEITIPEWKKQIAANAKSCTCPRDNYKLTDRSSIQVHALNQLGTDSSKQRDLLVVYGYNLDAYACVAALLRIGVPGKCIVMIQPPKLDHQKPAFEDPEVEEFVHAQLTRDEILVGRNFSLARWNGSAAADVEQIEELTFTSESKPLKLFCKGLFCFHEKTVDYDLFNAVNNACLVFDSRVVVDVNFHTNDPSVRAAGPVTKLQRIYYDDLWRHELCNSREVGQKLGQQLLDLFSPCTVHPISPVPDGIHLVPEFNEPKIVGCELPGGYQYLYVSKPDLFQPLEKRMQSEHFGRILRTGKADQGNGYFSLHINQYQLVQSVVCLTKKKIPVSNYIRLYNVHERLLNHLVSRFDEGSIPDLYDFLNDVWPLAIYHDRFANLLDEVRHLLYRCPPSKKESIAKKVHELLQTTGDVKPEELADLNLSYVKDGYKREVEQHLLSFINSNYNLLPMYAKPDLV